MAIKSHIAIEVDDTAWQKFTKTFREYEETLNETDGLWGTIGRKVTETSVSFESMSRNMLNQSQALHKSQADWGNANRHSATMANSWKMMAKNAGEMVLAIGDITLAILTWDKAIAGVKGLLGSGGLFGITRMAQSAVTQSMSAVGMGTTVGGRNAFNLNFSQAVDDPNSYLKTTGEALRDPGKRALFTRVGMSESDIQAAHGDTSAVAVQLLEHLRTFAKNTPEGVLGTTMRAVIPEGVTNEADLKKLKNMSDAQFSDLKKSYSKDRKDLDLDQKTTDAWGKLTMQLQRAGIDIENTFIKGLAPLAKPLENLSKALVGFVEDIMKSDGIKWGIEKLGEGLKWIGDFVGGDKFKPAMIEFVNEIAAISKAIGHAVESIYNWLEGKEKPIEDRPKDQAPAGAEPGIHFNWKHFQFQDDKGSGNDPNDQPPTLYHGQRGLMPEGYAGMMSPISYRVPQGGGFNGGMGSPMGFARPNSIGGNNTDKESQAHDYFASQGYNENAIDGMLAYIRGESNFNEAAFNPAGGGQGAQGIGQWRGERLDKFKQLTGHGMDQSNFKEQLEFMNWEMRNTETKTGDELRDIGSAGAAGMIMTRDYGRSEANTMQTLTQQRAATAEAYKNQYAGNRVQINVNNQAGANVHITSSALAT